MTRIVGPANLAPPCARYPTAVGPNWVVMGASFYQVKDTRSQGPTPVSNAEGPSLAIRYRVPDTKLNIVIGYPAVTLSRCWTHPKGLYFGSIWIRVLTTSIAGNKRTSQIRGLLRAIKLRTGHCTMTDSIQFMSTLRSNTFLGGHTCNTRHLWTWN